MIQEEAHEWVHNRGADPIPLLSAHVIITVLQSMVTQIKDPWAMEEEAVDHSMEVVEGVYILERGTMHQDLGESIIDVQSLDHGKQIEEDPLFVKEGRSMRTGVHLLWD